MHAATRRHAALAAACADAGRLRAGATRPEFLGDQSGLRLARPRQDAIAAARRLGCSLPAIGAAFRRDHTTVIHAVRAAEGRAAADPAAEQGLVTLAAAALALIEARRFVALAVAEDAGDRP